MAPASGLEVCGSSFPASISLPPSAGARWWGREPGGLPYQINCASRKAVHAPAPKADDVIDAVTESAHIARTATCAPAQKMKQILRCAQDDIERAQDDIESAQDDIESAQA